MTRIVAPARLHFGLFHVPTGEPTGLQGHVRHFGGVGLMIEQPGTVVTVRPAASWQVEGTLASRAQVFAQRFLASLPEVTGHAFQILVERCPPEHVGLGVGTQLGLAVTKALAIELGMPSLSAAALAPRIGRGERSAVGIHGFDRGGLILEAGKLPNEAVSPLLQCVTLPESWRVVLAIPPTATGWHGDRERSAFARMRDEPTMRGEQLRSLATHDLLPAAMAADLSAFGDAVHEFNRLAGEPFAADQGGIYASPAIAELIREMAALGVKGVGQSSWGPTVFGFTASDAEARAIVVQLRGTHPKLQVFATRPSPSGASVVTEAL